MQMHCVNDFYKFFINIQKYTILDNMATNNPNVDAIVGYVDQQRVPLIGKSVLGAKAPQYFNLMTGVKGTTALNILNADPALQCGNACGFTSENDTTFTQREIEAIPFKVNMTFCDKNLLDTWANYEVKVAAGIKNLPFEEEWTGQIVAKVQDQLEKFIWAGGTYCEKTAKGIEGILSNEGGIKVTATAGDSIYKKLVDLYLALPATVQAADDVITFVNYKSYNELVQELLSTSNYRLDVTNLEDGIVLPGTRVKVIPTQGIGSGNQDKTLAVMGRASNFYFGTDMRGDSEVFDLWYSQDNREFRLAIEFTAGTQVAFPDEAGILVSQA